MAPRIDVRGIRYTTQQRISRIPRLSIRLSGYPTRANPCTTGAGLISFNAALKSINSTGRALITRPVQSIFFDAGALDAADAVLAGLSAIELMHCPLRRPMDGAWSLKRQIIGVPRSYLLGVRRRLLAVHHPGDAELIDEHGKTLGPEGFQDGHGYLSPFRQRMEYPLRFRGSVHAEGHGKALWLRKALRRSVTTH